MGRVPGMEISSSQGLKKPPKISPREEKLSSQEPQDRGRQAFSFPGANFKVFYNPRKRRKNSTHFTFSNAIFAYGAFVYLFFLYALTKIGNNICMSQQSKPFVTILTRICFVSSTPELSNTRMCELYVTIVGYLHSYRFSPVLQNSRTQ